MNGLKKYIAGLAYDRKDGLTSHDRITLSEAKRRLNGTASDKGRGGQTRNRRRRMLQRGHKMFDWMAPKS